MTDFSVNNKYVATQQPLAPKETDKQKINYKLLNEKPKDEFVTASKAPSTEDKKLDKKKIAAITAGVVTAVTVAVLALKGKLPFGKAKQVLQEEGAQVSKQNDVVNDVVNTVNTGKEKSTEAANSLIKNQQEIDAKLAAQQQKNAQESAHGSMRQEHQEVKTEVQKNPDAIKLANELKKPFKKDIKELRDNLDAIIGNDAPSSEKMKSGMGKFLDNLFKRENVTEKDIISMADNMAMQHDVMPDAKDKAVCKKLYNQFNVMLKKQGIEVVESSGIKFDPRTHCASETVVTNDKDLADTIVETTRAGYKKTSGEHLRAEEVKIYKYVPSNVNEAEQKLLNQYGEDCIESLSHYKKGCDQEINQGLRLGKADSDTIKMIEDIDKSFEKAAPSANETTLYRGVRIRQNSKFAEVLNNLKVGDTLVEDGYMSTTTDLNIARSFENGENGFMFEIKMPKGSKTINVEDFTGTEIFKKNAGNIRDEAEVLLQRGSNFKVASIEKGEGSATKIKLEYVGNKPKDLSVLKLDTPEAKLNFDLEKIYEYPDQIPLGNLFFIRMKQCIEASRNEDAQKLINIVKERSAIEKDAGALYKLIDPCSAGGYPTGSIINYYDKLGQPEQLVKEIKAITDLAESTTDSTFYATNAVTNTLAAMDELGMQLKPETRKALEDFAGAPQPRRRSRKASV